MNEPQTNARSLPPNKVSLSSSPSQINFSRATNNGEQACSVLVLLTGTGAECLLTNRCRLETHIFVVLVKLFQIFNPPWITYHVKSGNNLKYEIAKTLSFVSSDLSVFNQQIIRTSFLTQFVFWVFWQPASKLPIHPRAGRERRRDCEGGSFATRSRDLSRHALVVC